MQRLFLLSIDVSCMLSPSPFPQSFSPREGMIFSIPIQPRQLIIPLKMWNDYFFQDVSLSAMGYSMCLGHSGEPCPITTNICTKMTMLHTNGLHFMNVKFCSCPSSPPRRIQLLRCRLFPATDEQPRTCATFDLLHHTHILLLQSNISTFNIYNTLQRLTDNSGIVDIPVMTSLWFACCCGLTF